MRRKPAHAALLEADILKQVRLKGSLSRTELARALGMSGSTAGLYVERLMAHGLLTEAAAPSYEFGRPPKLLQLNPQGGEFIGVDFEARNIMAVALDFAEKPLRRAHVVIDGDESAAKIVAKIQRAVTEVLPEDTKRLFAIGIGVPGQVDAAAGVAIRYEHLAQWRDVPLVRIFEDQFRVPVSLENTMRAMALAELWLGHGRGVADFACICVRSGMGAGIVLNGQLHRGAHQSAGEFGRSPCPPLPESTARRFRIDRASPLELQDIVSVRAIQAAFQRAAATEKSGFFSGFRRPVTFEDIRYAAEQKDPLTLELIGHVAEALGAALAANVVLTLDPAKLIMVGQLNSLGEIFFERLRQQVVASLKPSGITAPEIVQSAMGDHVGAFGAAALALHNWTPAKVV